MKQRIYIAGPMSGLPELNRPAFFAKAAAIEAQGHVALNPAILPDGLEQHEYMAICLQFVQMADRLLMLPGWQQSAGAMAEYHLAVKLGKPVLCAVTGEQMGVAA